MARELCMERPQTAPSASAASDDELVQRYYEHADHEALEALLARHADISFRVALRMTGNAADAEEIVQRAFLEVVQGKNRFAQASAFRTWLVGIVVNTARMWAREERRRKQREEIAVQMREQTVSEPQEGDAVLQKAAVDMVRELPEHYRLPVWMHYFEGLTFREIAGVLDQPEGTIRSQASRGLDALRQQLATVGYAAPPAVLPGLLAGAPMEAAPLAMVASLKALVAQGAGAGAAAGTAGTAAASKGSAFLGSLAVKGAVGLAAAAAIAGSALLLNVPDAPKPPEAKAQAVREAPPEPLAAPAAGPQPTGSNISGWRGDWTGRWPDATPPTVWGRYNKAIHDHRCQSAKPKGDKPDLDEPLTHGLLREWLVIGPFDVPDGSDSSKELDGAQIPEADVQPDAGDTAGGQTWNAWTGTGAKMATLNNYGLVGVSFTRLFGQVENKAAYAHSYLYSPAGGAYRLNFSTWQSTRVWMNGQLVCPRVTTQQHASQHVDVTLKPGWNRLLVKSAWGKGKIDSEWSAWKFAVSLQPRDKGGALEEKNLRWHADTPGSSISAPLVVGDKIVITADPYYVACYDKNDGKRLWLRSMSFFDMATEEQRKAIPDFEAKAKPVLAQMAAAREAFVRGDGSKLDPAEKTVAALLKDVDPARANKMNAWEQNQPGWTVTPCSDGSRLWVWCQTGAAACYDLDGKPIWSRQEDFPGNRHHGFSISPTLAAGKFIAMQNHITAYDCETGKTAWTAKGMTLTWGSLLPVRVGGQDTVFSTDGTLLSAADGKILWGPSKLGSSIVPTPVTDGADTLFAYSSGKGLAAYKLPGMQNLWNENGPKVQVGAGWAGSSSGSPLYHDGLLYTVSMTGVLTCRDAKNGALVYAQDLNCAPQMGYVGTPGMSASLSMAGKYLYATDNTFVTIVFEPGRVFKQVAKNVIEMPGEGQIWSYPVFDGSRMYYRGPKYLYCIGEK